MAASTEEHGVQGEPHEVTFDYNTWGLMGKPPAEAGDSKTVAPFAGDLQPFTAKLAALTNLEDFQLVHAAQVHHYRGEAHEARNLVWLRYERSDGQNTGIGGEHISATLDLETQTIVGITRQFAALNNDAFVSHQEALQTAMTFLANQAPDILAELPKQLPQLKALENGTRIEFPDPIKMGRAQIMWIDDHKETITVDQADESVAAEVHGMKVKMYMPDPDDPKNEAKGLWGWVMVDKNNEILTFERDISWDFEKFQRDSQMWLHDEWLKAQDIVELQPPAMAPQAALGSGS